MVEKPIESTLDTKSLEDYVSLTIDEETSELQRLVQILSSSIRIEKSNSDIISTNFALSSADLEAFAIQIPAECLRLQGIVNQYNVGTSLRDMVIEGKVSDTLSQMQGEKGTAEERRKRAEAKFMDDRLLNQANKMIAKGIQMFIDRSDKTYEGIKKVLDFRGKEGFLSQKGQI